MQPWTDLSASHLREAGRCFVDPDDIQEQAVSVLRGLNVHPDLSRGACLLDSPAWHAALQQRFEPRTILHKPVSCVSVAPRQLPLCSKQDGQKPSDTSPEMGSSKMIRRNPFCENIINIIIQLCTYVILYCQT